MNSYVKNRHAIGRAWYNCKPDGKTEYGSISIEGYRLQQCYCGFEAEDISAHVNRYNELVKEELQKIDASQHVSYWCDIQDHCCCTDMDWAICNCICHTQARDEERYCKARLERWNIARTNASDQLSAESGKN